MNRTLTAVFAVLVAAGLSGQASSQAQPDFEGLMAAQRKAMTALDFLDGTWRGPAEIATPSGEKLSLTQTERVGPMLDGGVKVIEGRGYESDGSVGFNALAVVSYDPEKRAYMMRSYARGLVGDFPLTVKPDGFVWEIPAGPATIRYTADIKDGTWHEIGERIMAGTEPVRFHEMTLKRVGDTDWPAAGAPGPK